ncbi:MAG TPA: Nif3-like dinuclear metal center hexameric protein [Clostridia bacterium]|nr:Nif3-like dinuclear metal center hexameric protein [Clostridia bacterium]
MKPTVQDIYRAIDRAAPFELAVPGDNSGILAGDPDQTVDTVLVALDAAIPVVREAKALGAQLIVTHHPILFNPVRRILCGDPQTEVAYRIAQAGLSMIAVHTNLDRAEGGINDELALRLGWQASPAGEFLRVGEIPVSLSPAELIAHVRQRVGGTPSWIGPEEAKVRRFAICGGSGGSEVFNAHNAGAEVLITGELKHSDALAACDLGLCIVAVGHGASEICAVDLIRKHLQNASHALKWNLCVRESAWQLLA